MSFVTNIGTGRGLSTLEVVEGFEKGTGVKVNWTYAPRREGDIEQVWGQQKLREDGIQ